MFNDQLSTLNEALALAEEINRFGIGGGINPYDPENPNKSGIYIPWYGIMVYFLPGTKDRKFYHFRFKNGTSGINVGLVLQSKANSPVFWTARLALDVNPGSNTEPWIVD